MLTLRNLLLAFALSIASAIGAVAPAFAANTMTCTPRSGGVMVHHDYAAAVPNGYFYSTDGIENCTASGVSQSLQWVFSQSRLKTADGAYTGPWVEQDFYIGTLGLATKYWVDEFDYACPVSGPRVWLIETKVQATSWSGKTWSGNAGATSYSAYTCSATAVW